MTTFRVSLLAATSLLTVGLLSGCGGSDLVEPAVLPDGGVADAMTVTDGKRDGAGISADTYTFNRPLPNGTTVLCLVVWPKGSASASTQCWPEPVPSAKPR